ncbi:1-acyl-sn-glycerol-3-phosphate acyltransferase [Pseudoruegeria sp. HB172150]|uniref:lysophospholipid acyltransferase family protein n=1 Tax=Pseudoruegeria sp. HB172150 TaxID=2721164 RepID=UPI0015563FB5|nr:lysophospholipid acyltransferase family protein [Pseudoruegeria sp. HB172150]
MKFLRKWLASLAGHSVSLVAHTVTAVRGIWDGVEPGPIQRVYFANHTSNADTVLIWTVLPPRLRKQTRPVAAADYWLTSPLRRFFGKDVFNTVLIDRRREERTEDPVKQMVAALDEGSSLIIFPEGKRNSGDTKLLPFKTGLYHLAKARPKVDLVPVWIENLNRVMPKGEIIPLPLLCTVRFGAPVHLAEGDDKEAFLARASDALLALSNGEDIK